MPSSRSVSGSASNAASGSASDPAFGPGSNRVPLWRNRPPTSPPHPPRGRRSRSPASLFPLHSVFPSGRQALSAGLRVLGLRRPDRLAIPEWSSQCLLSAVGACATPLPMREATAFPNDVAAILVYEQWGWPLAPGALEECARHFPGAAIILDRVDSPVLDHSSSRAAIRLEVWSLYKTLGLRGGGLARLDGKWLGFQPLQGHAGLARLLDRHPDDIVTHILKSDIAALPPSLQSWLRRADLPALLKAEREARQERTARVLESPLCRDYPEWMKNAPSRGAGPGIFPLMRNAPVARLRQAAAMLLRRHHIQSEIYHFNFSGRPLRPSYELCLAMPVHGQISPELLAAAVRDIA